MDSDTITIYEARTLVRNGLHLQFGATEDRNHPGWWMLYCRGQVVVNSRKKVRVYKSISSAVLDLCFVFRGNPFSLHIDPIFQEVSK